MSPRRQGLILLGRVTRIEGAVAHCLTVRSMGVIPAGGRAPLNGCSGF